MDQPFKDLAELDRLIHQPSRLAITTALSACDQADFLYLQQITGLSKGNLSSHVGKLEDGGIVVVEKAFEGKTPKTWLSLTEKGQQVIASYWDKIDNARNGAAEWSESRAD